MASIVSDQELDVYLVSLIDNLGGNGFYSALGATSKYVTGYESCLLVYFDFEGRPRRLHDDLDLEQQASSIQPYFEGAYLLDPFYALFCNGAPTGIYRLRDCAPDSFFTSEYYRNYYLQTGLIDETGLLIRLNANACVLISIGNRAQIVTTQVQVKNLQRMLPILGALCCRHVAIEQHESNTNQSTPLSKPLDIAFRNFGKELLSKREREVVQLILKGHSNKSIAKLLEISIDTVKVYNKRFHTKLNVSSQAELFSLFLESISTAPVSEDVDPLAHYLSQTGTDISQK